jgi:hypothetical protein
MNLSKNGALIFFKKFENWGLTVREYRLKMFGKTWIGNLRRKCHGTHKSLRNTKYRERDSKEIHTLHSLPNTIKVYKTRTWKWVEHTACKIFIYFEQKPHERNHLSHLRLKRRMI